MTEFAPYSPSSSLFLSSSSSSSSSSGVPVSSAASPMAFACAHSWSYARVPNTTGDLCVESPSLGLAFTESAARSNSLRLLSALSVSASLSPCLARIFRSSTLSSSAADASAASRADSVSRAVAMFVTRGSASVVAAGGTKPATSSSSATCATKIDEYPGRSSSIGMATGMCSSPSPVTSAATAIRDSSSSSSSFVSGSSEASEEVLRSEEVFTSPSLSLRSRTCHGSRSFARISSSSHSVIPSASILASSAASLLMNLYGSRSVTTPALCFSSASRL